MTVDTETLSKKKLDKIRKHDLKNINWLIWKSVCNFFFRKIMYILATDSIKFVE